MSLRLDARKARASRIKESENSLVVTTRGGKDTHTHCAIIRPDGSGYTTPGPDGHIHTIVGLDLLAAFGGSDDHRHELTAMRCFHSAHKAEYYTPSSRRRGRTPAPEKKSA